MTSMKLTAIFMKVPEGYVAFLEELRTAFVCRLTRTLWTGTLFAVFDPAQLM